MLFPHDMTQVIPLKVCAICGSTEKLVRDHDHKTGYIRGILCEVCNVYLGSYESKLITPLKRKPKYRTWVRTYRERIELHLKSDTGIIYRSRRVA